MKVLLIHPQMRIVDVANHPPYGLLQLATIVDEFGFHVRVIDNNAYRLPIDALRQTIKEGAEDIIGISGLTIQVRYIQEIVRVCREEHPAALIVAGGEFLSAQPFDMLRWINEIDIGCVGEGYNTWREILKRYDDKKWSKVKGLVYREGKKVKLSPMRPVIEEYYYCEKHKSKRLTFEQTLQNDFKCHCCERLKNNFDDQVPNPAYELSPVETYLRNSPIPYSVESSGVVPLNVGETLRRLDVMSSSGCPWRCSFCSESKPFRQHSPQHVVNFIDDLRRRYGLNFASFIDENFTVNRRWFMKFCECFEQTGLATFVHWGIGAHSATVDVEMLRKGHDVGLSYIVYCGESASPRLLKEMGKGQTPEQMVAAIEATQAAQINPIMSFTIGYPTETIDDVIQTCQFFIDNQVQWVPFFLQAPPGTELFQKYKDKIIDQHLTDKERELVDLAKTRKTPTIQAEAEKARESALQRWILSLDAAKLSCNLTKFTDVELAGLQYMLAAWDIERLKKFRKSQTHEFIRGW